jgi:hypothetical protein
VRLIAGWNNPAPKNRKLFYATLPWLKEEVDAGGGRTWPRLKKAGLWPRPIRLPLPKLPERAPGNIVSWICYHPPVNNFDIFQKRNCLCSMACCIWICRKGPGIWFIAEFDSWLVGAVAINIYWTRAEKGQTMIQIIASVSNYILLYCQRLYLDTYMTLHFVSYLPLAVFSAACASHSLHELLEHITLNWILGGTDLDTSFRIELIVENHCPCLGHRILRGTIRWSVQDNMHVVKACRYVVRT